MALQITSETLYVGDSWSWTESLSDYPATSYSLQIVLKYRDNPPVILNGSADGDDFDFTYSAANSSKLPSGGYAYQVVATKTSDSTVTTIERGKISLLPNLKTSTDTRNHYEKVIDAIEAVIEQRATEAHQSISINGRNITKYSHAELIAVKSKYEFMLKQEKRKEKMAQGLDPGGRIKIQFK